VPVLKKFIQEEKARVKEDKATAKKLVTKGGKPELIELIKSYFGIKMDDEETSKQEEISEMSSCSVP
jgi:hypothetical protein